MEILDSSFRFSFYLFVSVLKLSCSYSTVDFTLLDDARYGSFRVGDPWLDRSVTSCLATCQFQYATCHSAVYDPETKMCTPAKRAHLYTAKNQDKLDLFIYIAKNVFRAETWLGLSDIVQEGTFVWEDGELLNSSQNIWGTVPPDNNLEIENCVAPSAAWNYQPLNDNDCTILMPYVCELEDYFN